MEMSSRENPSPPLTPQQTSNGVPITRSDPSSPYPTTFVTADTSSFKQVVQMLTGSSETPKNTLSGKPPTTPTASDHNHHHHHHHHLPPTPSSSSSRSFVIPPIKTAPSKKQQQQQQSGFKLYERRMKNSLLMISPLTAGAHFPHHQHHQNSPGGGRVQPPEILSPSVLDFPSLTLSPVTPLSAAGDDDQFDKSSHSSKEERAIAEKGYYLHPSPMSTPRDAEPQLLPLFPVTSPRVSDPSSSTS